MRSFPKNTVIINEGDRGDSLFVILSGRARVGPADEPFELSPGDYLRYPGDAPHVFEALEPGTSAVLVSDAS